MQTEAYEYHPAPSITDHAAAMRLLAARVPNPVVNGWPVATADERLAMQDRFAALGLPVQPLKVDPIDYWAYRELADYEHQPVQYPAGSLIEKSFEHYIVFGLLAPQPREVLIDVASQISPLPRIAAMLFGSSPYAQDIMYPAGVHGRRIGGDAAAMPVPDGFAVKACLTCSFEHFEGRSDTALIRELGRVIQPGGRVVIVPLYVFPTEVAVTDPLLSTAADVPFDTSATIHCAEGWGTRHARMYTPETLLERVVTPARESFDVRLHRIDGAADVDASIYARWVLTLDRR